MSKVFPKLAKSITMAAKSGGPDPESNATLRVAINNAKAQNLSRDNIEAAIKRAAGSDAADISEVTYEGKGPHGTQFIIECATDNTNRSVTNLKTIFNKNNCQMLNSGSLDFMFSRKSVIEFPIPEGKDLEEIEFELIDAGLEEMIVDEDQISVIGDYTESMGVLSSITTATYSVCANAGLVLAAGTWDVQALGRFLPAATTSLASWQVSVSGGTTIR